MPENDTIDAPVGILNFEELRVQNLGRCGEAFHPIKSWSPTDWMTAIAGEVGEAANLVKKLRRLESGGLDAPANQELAAEAPSEIYGSEDARLIYARSYLAERVAEELADAVIYIDLLASRLDINLGAAVAEKFNKTSVKVGSERRLPVHD